MPGVIVVPRRDKKYPYFEHWGAHFALQGYPTLCIEVYDKKLSLNEFVSKYIPILRSIKQEFVKDKRVDANKFVYLGVEDSAKIALLVNVVNQASGCQLNAENGDAWFTVLAFLGSLQPR